DSVVARDRNRDAAIDAVVLNDIAKIDQDIQRSRVAFDDTVSVLQSMKFRCAETCELLSVLPFEGRLGLLHGVDESVDSIPLRSILSHVARVDALAGAKNTRSRRIALSLLAEDQKSYSSPGS